MTSFDIPTNGLLNEGDEEQYGLSLGFRNVGFSVKSRGGIFGPQEQIHILQDASGTVLPGQCCAILGSSGGWLPFSQCDLLTSLSLPKRLWKDLPA